MIDIHEATEHELCLHEHDLVNVRLNRGSTYDSSTITAYGRNQHQMDEFSDLLALYGISCFPRFVTCFRISYKGASVVGHALANIYVIHHILDFHVFK